MKVGRGGGARRGTTRCPRLARETGAAVPNNSPQKRREERAESASRGADQGREPLDRRRGRPPTPETDGLGARRRHARRAENVRTLIALDADGNDGGEYARTRTPTSTWTRTSGGPRGGEALRAAKAQARGARPPGEVSDAQAEPRGERRRSGGQRQRACEACCSTTSRWRASGEHKHTRVRERASARGSECAARGGRAARVCVVTGKAAKYRDAATNQFFANGRRRRAVGDLRARNTRASASRGPAAPQTSPSRRARWADAARGRLGFGRRGSGREGGAAPRTRPSSPLAGPETPGVPAPRVSRPRRRKFDCSRRDESGGAQGQRSLAGDARARGGARLPRRATDDGDTVDMAKGATMLKKLDSGAGRAIHRRPRRRAARGARPVLARGGGRAPVHVGRVQGDDAERPEPREPAPRARGAARDGRGVGPRCTPRLRLDLERRRAAHEAAGGGAAERRGGSSWEPPPGTDIADAPRRGTAYRSAILSRFAARPASSTPAPAVRRGVRGRLDEGSAAPLI